MAADRGNVSGPYRIIEGNVKFRDGKRWKRRWCALQKLSPVSDCLHICLHKDSRRQSSRCLNGLPGTNGGPAVVALEDFCGIDIGFHLDRETHVMAVICRQRVILLALNDRPTLDAWCLAIRRHLGMEHRFLVDLIKPQTSILRLDTPVQLFVRGSTLCLASCSGNGSGPPRNIASWTVRDLRRYGILEGKFCFEVANNDGQPSGANGGTVYAVSTPNIYEIDRLLRESTRGRSSSLSDAQTVVMRTRETLVHTFPRRSPPGGSTLLDSQCIYAMLNFEKDGDGGCDEMDDDDSCAFDVNLDDLKFPKGVAATTTLTNFSSPISETETLVNEAEFCKLHSKLELDVDTRRTEADASFWNLSHQPSSRSENLYEPPTSAVAAVAAAAANCAAKLRESSSSSVKRPTATTSNGRANDIDALKRDDSIHLRMPAAAAVSSDCSRRRYSCGDQLMATWWNLVGRAASFTDLRCVSRSLSQLCCSMSSSGWLRPRAGLATWCLAEKPASNGLELAAANMKDYIDGSTTVEQMRPCLGPQQDAVDGRKFLSKSRLSAPHLAALDSNWSAEESAGDSAAAVHFRQRSAPENFYQSVNYCPVGKHSPVSLSTVSSSRRSEHAEIHRTTSSTNSACSSDVVDADLGGSYITLKMVAQPAAAAASSAAVETGSSSSSVHLIRKSRNDFACDYHTDGSEEENVFFEVNLPEKLRKLTTAADDDEEKSALLDERLFIEEPGDRPTDAAVVDGGGGGSGALTDDDAYCAVNDVRRTALSNEEVSRGYVPMELPAVSDTTTTTPAVAVAASNAIANRHQLGDDSALIAASLTSFPYVPMNLSRYVQCIPGTNRSSTSSNSLSAVNETRRGHHQTAPATAARGDVSSSPLCRSNPEQTLYDLIYAKPSVTARALGDALSDRPLRRSSSVAESSSLQRSSSRQQSGRLLRFISKGKSMSGHKKQANESSLKSNSSESSVGSCHGDDQLDSSTANGSRQTTKHPAVAPRPAYPIRRLPSPKLPPPPVPEDDPVAHMFAQVTIPNRTSTAETGGGGHSAKVSIPAKAADQQQQQQQHNRTSVKGKTSPAMLSISEDVVAGSPPYANISPFSHSRPIATRERCSSTSDSPKSCSNGYDTSGRANRLWNTPPSSELHCAPTLASLANSESFNLKSASNLGQTLAESASLRSLGSSAVTTLRPRYGAEYQRVDRRRQLAADASLSEDWSASSTPQPSPYSVTSSSVFTFDASSSGGEDIATPTPYRSRFAAAANEPAYVNMTQQQLQQQQRLGSGENAIMLDQILTNPGSRRCASADSGEVNYAQIDLSDVSSSTQLHRPTAERLEPTAYAVIDLVATAAAAQTGREHAWLRHDRLQRRSTRRSESAGVCRNVGRTPSSLARKSSMPTNWGDSPLTENSLQPKLSADKQEVIY